MKSSRTWIKASLAAFVVMTLEGHDTQAAPPENPLSVTVTNTGANPVPVVGTVEVTNVPDVNIAGGQVSIDPNGNQVSVSSLPAVSLAAGTGVSVSNAASQPLHVRYAELGGTPLYLAGGNPFGTDPSAFMYRVPPGKRAVVEWISCSFTPQGGDATVSSMEFQFTNAAVVVYYLPLTATARNTHRGTMTARTVADEDTLIVARTTWDGSAPGGKLFCSLYGTLFDK